MAKRRFFEWKGIDPIRWLIGGVWLANGLICKLLNVVPRHAQIVARILGPQDASLITKLIGVGEVFVAIWIFSSAYSRWCTLLQLLLVGAMNLLEFFLAPDLLLFGRFNLLIALVFMMLIFAHEFVPYRPVRAQSRRAKS
jgi:DoxX-like family